MRSVALLIALIVAAPAGAQQAAANIARVYALHEVEVLPRPRNAAELAAALQQTYPAHLREAGMGGMVRVAFVVGPDGQPGDVRVVSTSDTSFNAPSAQAVSLLRFTPAQVQGRPVAVRVEQPIIWRTEPAPPVAATESTRPRVLSTADKVALGYELVEVEELPRLRNPDVFIRALAREYPPALRHTGQSGFVNVRFRVEPDGTTSSATVTRTSDPEFVEPTLRAVAVMRFSPARVNGRPVRTWVEQPVQWSVAPTMRPDAADLDERPMFGNPFER